MTFSEWIDYKGTGCPVDEDRTVEIESVNDIISRGPAIIFNWIGPAMIVRYRVALTADEIAEEEEWERVEKASKTG